MTIDELICALHSAKRVLGKGDAEVTAEGQEITGDTICTNMQTGVTVLDLDLNDSERLDLEDHPAFAGDLIKLHTGE